jgi:hypothetical protein
MRAEALRSTYRSRVGRSGSSRWSRRAGTVRLGARRSIGHLRAHGVLCSPTPTAAMWIAEKHERMMSRRLVFSWKASLWCRTIARARSAAEPITAMQGERQPTLHTRHATDPQNQL